MFAYILFLTGSMAACFIGAGALKKHTPKPAPVLTIVLGVIVVGCVFFIAGALAEQARVDRDWFPQTVIATAILAGVAGVLGHMLAKRD